MIYKTYFFDSAGNYLLIFCQNNSILHYDLLNTAYSGIINLNKTLSKDVVYSAEARYIIIGNNINTLIYSANCTSSSAFDSSNMCAFCTSCTINETCDMIQRICVSILVNSTVNLITNLTLNSNKTNNSKTIVNSN